jgi:hypothetical protein
MQPNRFQPRVPPTVMKTYRISAPLATHFRTGVSCAQYQCEAYLLGWETRVDEATDQGQRQAAFIRKSSRRKFAEERDETGLTVFTFEAGQEGFASDADNGHGNHRRRIDRPEVFIERAGDHRGNPTGMRLVHKRPDDWLESFAENQDRVKTMKERG